MHTILYDELNARHTLLQALTLKTSAEQHDDLFAFAAETEQQQQHLALSTSTKGKTPVCGQGAKQTIFSLQHTAAV